MPKSRVYTDADYLDDQGNITSPGIDVGFELMIAVCFLHISFILIFALFA